MTEDELKQALIDIWEALIPNGNNGDAVVTWEHYEKLQCVIRHIAPERV